MPGLKKRWALAGAGTGLGLVTTATVIDAVMEASLAGAGGIPGAVLRLHASEHLLWVIDTSPVVLAVIGYGIGHLQERIRLAREHLEQEVVERTEELALELEERRQREAEREAVHRIREGIWRMTSADDIGRVLPLLKEALQGLEITFAACGLNLVDDTGDAPTFNSHSVDSSGRDLNTPSDSPTGEPLLSVWRSGQVLYRPDLGVDDRFDERRFLTGPYGDVRSVVDVPFSHGTLALNALEPDAFGRHLRSLQALTGVLSEAFGRRDDLRALDRHLVQVRRSQEQLRLITDTARDAVIMIDPRGDVTFWNPAAAAMFGYESEEIIGRNLHETIVPERFQAAHHAAFPDFQRTGQGAAVDQTLELEALRKGGEEFPIAISLASVRLDDGWHAVAVLRDITEQKRIADELEVARFDAEAANRAKSEFLANMSHEIRTPMNAIVGFADLLHDTSLTADQRDYVDNVRTAGAALVALINDILDFSKVEAGRLELEVAPFRLRDVVFDVADLLRDTAARRGLEFVVDVAEEVTDGLRGDALRLRQVLVNLLNNAMKFTEHGEVVLEVRRAATADDPGRLRFAVRDTGIGIPAHAQAKLFEAFTQADASTTRRFGGTGLGLSLCRRLVEMMQGELGVESVEGEGSTFAFDARFEVEVEAAAPARVLPASLRGARLLLAGAHPLRRQVLARLAGAMGLEAEAVGAGGDTLERLARQRQDVGPRPAGEGPKSIDLCVVDVDLPGLPQGDPVAALRAAGGAELPIVFMSPRSDLSGGADPDGVARVRRPVRPADLRRALVRAAGLPEEAHEDEAQKEAPGSGAQLVGVRILLAEDNALNQKLAVVVLGAAGCDVRVAANGRLAVEMVTAGAFDAVLMDVQMPEMDGIEATRRIRQIPGRADLPIIAMTASVQAADREQCQAAGMNGFVSKPIDRGELIEALRRVTQVGLPEAPAAETPAVPDAVATPPAASAAAAAEPETPRLHPEAAAARLGGDLGLLRELARDAVVEYGNGYVEQVCEALAAGRSVDAQRQAHTLKGMAGTLGADDLQAAAAALESAIRAGEDAAALEIRTAHVTTALEEALAALRSWLDTPSGIDAGNGESPSAPGGAVADWATLIPTLADAVALRDPVGAAEALEGLTPLPGAPGQLLASLREQLDDFDFDGARQTLARLADAVGVATP